MTDVEQYPEPDRQTELSDMALDWINSTFARTVTLKLTPVMLPVLGGLTAWLQDAIGLDLDPGVVAALVVSVVIGAAATIVMFVRNHGRGAALLGQAALELEKLYEAGNRELDKAGQTTYVHGGQGAFVSVEQGTPTTPPGIAGK